MFCLYFLKNKFVFSFLIIILILVQNSFIFALSKYQQTFYSSKDPISFNRKDTLNKKTDSTNKILKKNIDTKKIESQNDFFKNNANNDSSQIFIYQKKIDSIKKINDSLNNLIKKSADTNNILRQNDLTEKINIKDSSKIRINQIETDSFKKTANIHFSTNLKEIKKDSITKLNQLETNSSNNSIPKKNSNDNIVDSFKSNQINDTSILIKKNLIDTPNRINKNSDGQIHVIGRKIPKNLSLDSLKLPKTSFGKIERIQSFPSKYISNLNVDIWLPTNSQNSILLGNGKNTISDRYCVIYMHDGQMLYDSTNTWNNEEWGVDEVMHSLISRSVIHPCIVVGIWNSGNDRHDDYFPAKPYIKIKAKDKRQIQKNIQLKNWALDGFEPNADNYLKFITEELKPVIDSMYNVYSDYENTFMVGGGMGGLVSWYALCEYPKIFGGIASLSTHWLGGFYTQQNPIPEAFLEYLRKKLPKAKKHKLYFDSGNKDLDELYAPYNDELKKILKEKGYRKKDSKVEIFQNHFHSEKWWSKRLEGAFEFLLPLQ